VICTAFGNGKKHDFRLFKESKVRWTEKTCGVTDSGYTGIKKLQKNSRLPKKSSKKKPLTTEEKKQNRAISSERVVNENVIGSLKRFKIVSDRYILVPVERRPKQIDSNSLKSKKKSGLILNSILTPIFYSI
jgi:hypothetical protein